MTSGYPKVDPAALVAVAIKNREIRLHSNLEGLRMLAEWLTWLCKCPSDDNWEIHVGWRMNAAAASNGFQFCVIDEGPDLSKFFDPEEIGKEDEMTIMVVDSDELRAIVDRAIVSQL